ncbi:hypothetical protein Pla110_23600 [Polystyrenella longa]|uniref:Uncharacterized protein n=1 Tax=Polystyrenella longa TaxID=2528007 RepID=A0A518CN30_9PLAN|nr:hypothetical protein [Polystyrenella longa]QDU80629.1 hypothetical protein Pla110_23600 [Polystyrenella longa]
MVAPLIKYTFHESAEMTDVEASLLLAIFATEALHGESQVRLEAAHAFDAELHSCVIKSDGPVGRDLNRLFVGFLRREFGEKSFQIERLHQPILKGAYSRLHILLSKILKPRSSTDDRGFFCAAAVSSHNMCL